MNGREITKIELRMLKVIMFLLVFFCLGFGSEEKAIEHVNLLEGLVPISLISFYVFYSRASTKVLCKVLC